MQIGTTNQPKLPNVEVTFVCEGCENMCMVNFIEIDIENDLFNRNLCLLDKTQPKWHMTAREEMS